MSTWPDMTAVRVAAGVPVATGLALTPRLSANATTILLELEPLVEYAMVFFSVVSVSALSGESALTYQ